MANEHNQITRNLKKAYPHLKENVLYHKARLILAALMVKITVTDFLPAFNRNKVFRKTLDVLYKNDLGGEKKLNQVPRRICLFISFSFDASRYHKFKRWQSSLNI